MGHALPRNSSFVTLMTPEFSFVNDTAKLCAPKERQRRYFNRDKLVLSPAKAGETELHPMLAAINLSSVEVFN